MIYACPKIKQYEVQKSVSSYTCWEWDIVTELSSFTQVTNFMHSRFAASGVGLDIPLERRIPSSQEYLYTPIEVGVFSLCFHNVNNQTMSFQFSKRTNALLLCPIGALLVFISVNVKGNDHIDRSTANTMNCAINELHQWSLFFSSHSIY